MWEEQLVDPPIDYITSVNVPEPLVLYWPVNKECTLKLCANEKSSSKKLVEINNISDMNVTSNECIAGNGYILERCHTSEYGKEWYRGSITIPIVLFGFLACLVSDPDLQILAGRRPSF